LGIDLNVAAAMPIDDLLVIAGISLGISLLVALVGALALRLMRRAPLAAQLAIIVAVAAIAVVGSMVGVANRMFLSRHDLTVGVYVAVIAGTVALFFSVLLGLAVSRNFKRLTTAARDIGEGRSIAPTPIGSNAELRALALELGATSSRLAESKQREEQLEIARRELIAGISHDLRTPLAGIRAISEALEDGLADDRDRYLQNMRSKVDQLSGMVDDLFELSKIDAGMLTLSVSDVSLYDVVSDAVADLGGLAEGRLISVESSSADDFTVRADPRELSRAISNLLTNAVQHTPAGTPVTVRAGLASDGRPIISVIDAGGGIPEVDLERVFEPGWRGSGARTSLPGGKTGGAGLGLAIVAGILRAHQGEATVRNVPGGCRFDLVLPA
jgi:signal transduction histidine kinase